MGGTYTSISDYEYSRGKFGRMQAAREKLNSAMSGLRRNMPFIAVQIMRKPLTLDFDIPTLCTNGKEIKVGVDWVLNTPLWEVESGLVHEKFHDNLLHHIRLIGKDPEVGNIAADVVVNWNMQMSGYKIGEKWLTDYHLGKYSFEVVYDYLMSQKKQNQSIDGSEGLTCGGIPAGKEAFGQVTPMTGEQGGVPTVEEIQKATADAKMDMQVAAGIAKRAGKLPGNIERIVMVTCKGYCNWAEYVSSWMTTIRHEDFTWKKPNRMYARYGLCLPTLYNESMDELVVFCDTSGSIDNKMLTEMCNDIHALLSTFNIENMKVFWIDSEINKVDGKEYQEFSSHEEPNFKPCGGGGTSYRPGFEYLEKEDIQPVGVIYITDGWCSRFPRTEPEYPVLWVIIDGYSEEFKPPFGQTVYRHLG